MYKRLSRLYGCPVSVLNIAVILQIILLEVFLFVYVSLLMSRIGLEAFVDRCLSGICTYFYNDVR